MVNDIFLYPGFESKNATEVVFKLPIIPSLPIPLTFIIFPVSLDKKKQEKKAFWSGSHPHRQE